MPIDVRLVIEALEDDDDMAMLLEAAEEEEAADEGGEEGEENEEGEEEQEDEEEEEGEEHVELLEVAATHGDELAEVLSSALQEKAGRGQPLRMGEVASKEVIAPEITGGEMPVAQEDVEKEEEKGNLAPAVIAMDVTEEAEEEGGEEEVRRPTRAAHAGQGTLTTRVIVQPAGPGGEEVEIDEFINSADGSSNGTMTVLVRPGAGSSVASGGAEAPAQEGSLRVDAPEPKDAPAEAARPAAEGAPPPRLANPPPAAEESSGAGRAKWATALLAAAAALAIV